MGATMRAAVFYGPGQPLRLETVPRPTPGPDDAVIAVAGCGFCHTDLHYLDHGVRTARPPPLILGHEISGTVEALGPTAEGWTVGDRVVVPAVLSCGQCKACRSGRENICGALEMVGNHRDGGFAEAVRVPARHLVRLPSDVDLVRGAVIADALSTPYHAIVHRGEVQPGEWVAVVGCGGVGMNAVQFARAAGANVLAIDLSEERLALARRLGASATIVPGPDGEAVREVRRITGGGVDVAVEAVGRPSTIELALSTLGRGGRLVLLGYCAEPAVLPAARTMFFEQEIRGSLGCRPADYPKIIELVRSGKVRLNEVVTATLPLERIDEAADRLRRAVGLRTVMVPIGPAS